MNFPIHFNGMTVIHSLNGFHLNLWNCEINHYNVCDFTSADLAYIFTMDGLF